jgi:hypothetical protein
MAKSHDDNVKPFGKASLRYVAGHGWVQVPHLFRVTFRSPDAGEASYEVHTFHGRDKAVEIATSAYAPLGRPWHRIDVDELGPTEPGGSPTAIDDRAEW